MVKIIITFDHLLKIWADQGYQGNLIELVQQQWAIELEIVRAQEGQIGFAVQPRRWVVERTFAWFGKYRRLSKDYEHCTSNSESASIHNCTICSKNRRNVVRP